MRGRGKASGSTGVAECWRVLVSWRVLGSCLSAMLAPLAATHLSGFSLWISRLTSQPANDDRLTDVGKLC